jgi:hypothetical protein
MVEIVLCLAYISFFIFIISRLSFFKIEGIAPGALKIAFLVKIVFAFLLGYIFTYYYTDRLTADTFKFYDDSIIMFNVLHHHPVWFLQMVTGIGDDAEHLLPYYNEMHNWYNKAVIFNDYRAQIRINALLHFLSLGYYHVHAVFFCFGSFAGLTALFKLFVNSCKEKKWILFAGVYFMPSVLFWGSGLLKDSLILFATGLSLYQLNTFLLTKKIKPLVWFTLFFLLLMVIKFHNFILLLPLYFAFTVCHFIKRKHVLVFATTLCVYYLCLLKLDTVLPNYGLMDLLAKKQVEFIDLAKRYQAKSSIPLQNLEPSEWNAIRNTPEALYHVFLRPFPGEHSSPFIALAGLENLMLMLMIVFCFFSLSKNVILTPLLFLSLFYVFSLFELIGLVTPVMGAIVRYKIQALPFLVFSLVYLTDLTLLQKRFPVFFKWIEKCKV